MVTSFEAENVTLPPVKFREGFEVEEVDAFVDRIVAVLKGYEANYRFDAELSSKEVAAALFQPTKFRLGYSQDHVLAFLKSVSGTLRDYEARKPLG